MMAMVSGTESGVSVLATAEKRYWVGAKGEWQEVEERNLSCY